MQLDKPQLLITGANGFVGSRLCELAFQEGWPVRRAVRWPGMRDAVAVGDLGANTDWSTALDNIKIVVHLAARVHVMKEAVIDPLAEFRHVNVEGTLNLARQAVSAGVKRFVFISSIKVNGESTPLNEPYTAEDTPAPVDPYGISKYETEEGLRSLAIETGLEVVIIRPALVYGPGVKANFLSMIRWLNRGVPLPFGTIHNKRSLIALDNFVDLIITCIEHPAASNQIFLASDGEDLSSTELLQRVGLSLGRPARLVPVPVDILNLAARLLGKRNVAQRLLGSLQVDITKTRDLLGWTPPMGVDEALRKTAEGFLKAVEEQS